LQQHYCRLFHADDSSCCRQFSIAAGHSAAGSSGPRTAGGGPRDSLPACTCCCYCTHRDALCLHSVVQEVNALLLYCSLRECMRGETLLQSRQLSATCCYRLLAEVARSCLTAWCSCTARGFVLLYQGFVLLETVLC
jgi:hypothetical protein